MATTKMTPGQLEQTLIQELGFNHGCTCSGEQWLLTSGAAGHAASGEAEKRRVVAKRQDFLRLLRAEGVNITRLIGLSGGLRGFALNKDESQLSIWGTQCYTLRELCEVILKAME